MKTVHFLLDPDKKIWEKTCLHVTKFNPVQLHKLESELIYKVNFWVAKRKNYLIFFKL